MIGKIDSSSKAPEEDGSKTNSTALKNLKSE